MSDAGTTRRRRSRPDPSPSDQRLVIDWVRIADGRARRLRRGVDFDEPVWDFIESARSVAATMNRGVVLTRDRLDPERFIWVQFADAEIAIGDPCSCGGRQLTRMTTVLLRCDSCGAMLVTGARPKARTNRSPRAEDEGHAEGTSARTLSEFSEVRLVRTAQRSDAIEYVGLAVEGAGKRVLLAVQVPLVGGQPVPDPRSPTGQAHRVVTVVPESAWGTTDSEENDELWDMIIA